MPNQSAAELAKAEIRNRILQSRNAETQPVLPTSNLAVNYQPNGKIQVRGQDLLIDAVVTNGATPTDELSLAIVRGGVVELDGKPRVRFEEQSVRVREPIPNLYGIDIYYQYGAGDRLNLIAIELFSKQRNKEFTLPATNLIKNMAYIFVDEAGKISAALSAVRMRHYDDDFIAIRDDQVFRDKLTFLPIDATEFYVHDQYNNRFCNSVIWCPGYLSKITGIPELGYPNGKPVTIYGGFVYDFATGNSNYALENKVSTNNANGVIAPDTEQHIERTSEEFFDTRLLPGEATLVGHFFKNKTEVIGFGSAPEYDPSYRITSEIEACQPFLMNPKKRKVITTEQHGKLVFDNLANGNQSWIYTNGTENHYGAKYYDFAGSGIASPSPVKSTHGIGFIIAQRMANSLNLQSVNPGDVITFDWQASNLFYAIPVPVSAGSIDTNSTRPTIEGIQVSVGFNSAITSSVISSEESEILSILNATPSNPYPFAGQIPLGIKNSINDDESILALVKGQITGVNYYVISPGSQFFRSSVVGSIEGLYKYRINSVTIRIEKVFGYAPGTFGQMLSLSTYVRDLANPGVAPLDRHGGVIQPDTGSITQLMANNPAGARDPFNSLGQYYQSLQGSNISQWSDGHLYTWLDDNQGNSYAWERRATFGYNPYDYGEQQFAFAGDTNLDQFTPWNRITGKREHQTKIALPRWKFAFNPTSDLYEFHFDIWEFFDIFKNPKNNQTQPGIFLGNEVNMFAPYSKGQP